MKTRLAAGILLALCVATVAAQEPSNPEAAPPSSAAAPTSPSAAPAKPRAPLVVYLPRPEDETSSGNSTERVKAIGRAVSGADRKLGKAWGLQTLLALLFGGVLVMKLRRRARICPKCLTPLSKLGDPRDSGEDLDEKETQGYAESSEPIWSCHLCGESGTLRFDVLYSSNRACPRCRRRRLISKLTQIEPSGYLLYGLARVDEVCPCGHEANFLRSTPPHQAPDAGRGGFTVRR